MEGRSMSCDMQSQLPGSPSAERRSAPISGTVRHARLKFCASDRFLRELRRRVDEYFEQSGRRRRDCPQMYFKTATILAWFISAYVLLLFVATNWWTILPLAIILGVSIAAVGFNIQHDGGHRA